MQENHNAYVSTLSRIDWAGAEKTGATLLFASDVCSKLEPLFNGVYNDAVMIGKEIEQVATILQESVVRLLPIIQPKKGRKWRDDVLSGLCAKS